MFTELQVDYSSKEKLGSELKESIKNLETRVEELEEEKKYLENEKNKISSNKDLQIQRLRNKVIILKKKIDEIYIYRSDMKFLHRRYSEISERKTLQ